MKNILKIEDYVSHYLIDFFGISFKLRRRKARKIIAENQTNKLNEIREKIGKEKIRVGFLVSESSKWSYESIYELFEKNPFYEPIVLVSQLTIVHSGRTADYLPIEECYSFFKEKGYRVDYIYDVASKRYLDIYEKNIDLLFYQQQWELPERHRPAFVSKNSLTLCVPYSVNVMVSADEYMSNFHDFLWKYFIKNEIYMKELEEKVGCEIDNCYCVGSPKLDIYITERKKDWGREKPMIVYAPHHSFEAHSLRTATFQRNGIQILELAERTSNSIDWVFRPHPRFKMAVIKNKIMNRQEIDIYYKRWMSIGDVCEGGDYFKLFKSSAGLITDSISFLAEYLPTGAPVFHLVSDERRERYSKWMDKILDTYYADNSYADLERDFCRVILEGDDWKAEERISNIGLVLDFKKTSASKVFEIIEKEFL